MDFKGNIKSIHFIGVCGNEQSRKLVQGVVQAMKMVPHQSLEVYVARAAATNADRAFAAK